VVLLHLYRVTTRERAITGSNVKLEYVDANIYIIYVAAKVNNMYVK